jgi:hypothetical protein
MNSKSHTLKQIYKHYKSEVENPAEFKLFSALCIEFNQMIIDELLEGKEFNMQNNLGLMSIRRVERDPRILRIDWAASHAYKKELQEQGVPLFTKETGQGTKWHIYYTDKYYYEYHWTKFKCKIQNKSAYRFDATRGLKGNKERLVKLLTADDLAYLRFKKG